MIMETQEILIIDDDRDLTRSLRAILEEHQYRVDTANDAVTGMVKFETANRICLSLML